MLAMKKILSLLLLIYLTNVLFGEEKPQKYVYCEIQKGGPSFSSKIKILVDSGQYTKKPSKDNILKDKNGIVIEFNSMMDALNYMSDLGWEFVDTYFQTGNEGETCRWILRRKMETK